jgi:hypothetical protein
MHKLSVSWAVTCSLRVWVMVRASLRRVSDFTSWRAELRQAIYQYNALPRDGRPSPFTLFLGGEPNTASSMRAAAARAPADPGTDVDTVLREGAGAIRQQAAVDGDLTRRARAVHLNQTGRSPTTYKVGDAVWFWQDVSGGAARRADKRPRSCLTPWQAGTVTAVDGVRCSIAPVAKGRGRRKAYERHVTCLKRRGTSSAPPTTQGPASSGARKRDQRARATAAPPAASPPAASAVAPVLVANEDAVRKRMRAPRTPESAADIASRAVEGGATITEPPIPTPGEAASMRPAERKRASPPHELAPQRQPGALVNKANKHFRFAIDTPRRSMRVGKPSRAMNV